MKVGKILIILGIVFLLSSCYTQFRTFEERFPALLPETTDEATDKVSKETAPDDTTLAEADSSADSSEEKDTVVVKEREVCYWERTFFGDWELRCYESNYADYWHRYYNRPWWYRSYNYDPYDCHCPYHTFYHPNCEYCWYYCDRYHHYGYGNYGNYIYIHHIHDSSGSTGSMSTGSSGRVPVKMKSVGSGRKGVGLDTKKKLAGSKPPKRIPSSAPGVPKKKQDKEKVPDKNMSNTEKTKTGTDTDTSKSDKRRRKSRNRRFGRGR